MMLDPDEYRALKRLNRVLSARTESVIVGGIVFFLTAAWVASLVVGVALVVTPILLWSLYEARWHGWMAGFVIGVGAPIAGWFVLESGNAYMAYALAVAPLFIFYVLVQILAERVREAVSEHEALAVMEQ